MINNYYVYTLLCADQTLYTGYTNDIVKRFLTHQNKKGAKYTKIHSKHPLKLCYIKNFDNKSDALKYEYYFKRLTRQHKINIIKENSDNTKRILCQLPDKHKLTENDLYIF